MKNIIAVTTLLAAGAALANAATISIPIETGTLSQSSLQPDRPDTKTDLEIMTDLFGYGAGSYAGGNNNSITAGWGTNNEGTVSFDNITESYSVTLCGRKGVGGDWFGAVINASSLSLPSDESLLSFKLSFTGAKSTVIAEANIPTVQAILALNTDSGVYYKPLESIASGESGVIDWDLTSISDLGTVSQFAIYFQGGPQKDPANATDPYEISNIKASLTTGIIPEPSAFGLLAGAGALALVAARRRRQKKA